MRSSIFLICKNKYDEFHELISLNNFNRTELEEEIFKTENIKYTKIISNKLIDQSSNGTEHYSENHGINHNNQNDPEKEIERMRIETDCKTNHASKTFWEGSYLTEKLILR